MRLDHLRLKLGRFAPAFGLMLLALSLLVFSAPNGARAQERVENDPGKCAAINLAHYYMICAGINTAIHVMLKSDADKRGARASKKEREAVTITKENVGDFLQAASNLYKFAGRTLTVDDSDAQTKIHMPHVHAALEEYAEQVRQEIMGDRKPEKPNMYRLCTRHVLGAEIRDANKLNAKLKEYLREAEQLLQKQKSCLK